MIRRPPRSTRTDTLFPYTTLFRSQRHVGAGHGREFLAELLDVRALLADHDAGTGGVDRDARPLGRPLDHDPADAGLTKPLLQELAQHQVLVQLGGVALRREPARIPGAVDAQPQPDRIDLVTHQT